VFASGLCSRRNVRILSIYLQLRCAPSVQLASYERLFPNPFCRDVYTPAVATGDAFPPQSMVFRPSAEGDKARRVQETSNAGNGGTPHDCWFAWAWQFVDLQIVVVPVTAGCEPRVTRAKTLGTIWPATQSNRASQLQRVAPTWSPETPGEVEGSGKHHGDDDEEHQGGGKQDEPL
jgi:hypothetical protein